MKATTSTSQGRASAGTAPDRSARARRQPGVAHPLPLGPVRWVPGQGPGRHAGLAGGQLGPGQGRHDPDGHDAPGQPPSVAPVAPAGDQHAHGQGGDDGHPGEPGEGGGRAGDHGHRAPRPRRPVPPRGVGRPAGPRPQARQDEHEEQVLGGDQHVQQGHVRRHQHPGRGHRCRHPRPGGEALGHPGHAGDRAGQGQHRHGPGHGDRVDAQPGADAEHERVQGWPLDEGHGPVEGHGLAGRERVDHGGKRAGETPAVGQVGGRPQVAHAVGGGAEAVARGGHDQGGGHQPEGGGHGHCHPPPVPVVGGRVDRLDAGGPRTGGRLGAARPVHEPATVARRPAAATHPCSTTAPGDGPVGGGIRPTVGLPLIGVGGIMSPWPARRSSASTSPSRA